MVCLICGILFLILGPLVYRFPNLIAGYNTVTKEQKKKVNIKRLKTFMSISFFVYGLLLVITYIILYFTNNTDVGNTILFATIFPFAIFLIIVANTKKINSIE